jgi:trans-2,3-dihydro-3-hydroxyanthranilate isomerase
VPTPYVFHWLDVFTQQRFGGNPLVVFPDGRGLTDAQMQTIAREFNISETVYLLPPDTPRGTRRVRIFTPSRELPFAGHPTIGAAHLLATRVLEPPIAANAELALEENVGLVRVAVRPQEDGTLFLQLSAARDPEFEQPRLDLSVVAPALNLAPADFQSDLPVGMASCGTPFLIIPLRNTEALRRARTDGPTWARALAAGALGDTFDSFWTDHVYLITHDETTQERGVNLRVRMFAPGLGITEDPATGAAATALAAHLAKFTIADADGTFIWTIEQGIEMGRPSLLYLEADKRAGAITGVRVGGYAVWIGEGRLDID